MEHRSEILKGGTRSGKYKAVEDRLIEKLIEHKIATVYPSTKKFDIHRLIDDIKIQSGLNVKFEGIKETSNYFDTRLKSFGIEKKTIGYNLFLEDGRRND